MRSLVVATLALLVGCAGPGAEPEQSAMPNGLHLARGGLTADGLLAVGDAAGHCWRVAALALDGAVRAELEGPRAVDASCMRFTAAASADGTTLAIFGINLGRIDILRRADGRLERTETLTLPGSPAFPFPPPGANLALSADGNTLIAGAVDRGCREIEKVGVRCGVAYLFRRGTGGWRLAARLARPETYPSAYFGQTVLLLPQGEVLVGGPRLYRGPGALHLFAGAIQPALVQTLAPEDGKEPAFATSLAVSADGAWLAVGGGQEVALWRRHGRGYAHHRTLRPPEPTAGHFGDALALDAEGRTLLIGAPRAACAAGLRCGIAYLYRRTGSLWTLADTLRPQPELAEADFGHEVGLDPTGRIWAIEGKTLVLGRQ